MNAKEFLDYYDGLPTRTDQKTLRHRIITECKVKKNTFYSWLDRGNIPDEKALVIISNIIKSIENAITNE
jgi:hypothetical protein